MRSIWVVSGRVPFCPLDVVRIVAVHALGGAGWLAGLRGKKNSRDEKRDSRVELQTKKSIVDEGSYVQMPDGRERSRLLVYMERNWR